MALSPEDLIQSCEHDIFIQMLTSRQGSTSGWHRDEQLERLEGAL